MHRAHARQASPSQPARRPAPARLAAQALGLLVLATGPAFAKLPPPSDEAKAKAAEAAAKTAHGNKVADYKLCLSMNKVAAQYFAEAKKAGRAASAPTETPACADPGPFVYTPPAPAAAPAAAAGATPAAAAATPAATTTAAAAAKPAAPAPVAATTAAATAKK